MATAKLKLAVSMEVTALDQHDRPHELIIRNWSANDVTPTKPFCAIAKNSMIANAENSLVLTWEYKHPEIVTEVLQFNLYPFAHEMASMLGLNLSHFGVQLHPPGHIAPFNPYAPPLNYEIKLSREDDPEKAITKERTAFAERVAQHGHNNPSMAYMHPALPPPPQMGSISSYWEVVDVVDTEAGKMVILSTPHFPGEIVITYPV